MTREIGDILIQQTVDSDYEIERKVRIIEKIEKLVMTSLNIASAIVEKSASKQEQIEEAKQRLEAGETVREVSQDIPERVVRKVSRSIRTQDVHETPTNNVRGELETKPQELPKEDKPVLEVATYSIEDEKMVAMKRLVGLTGLKRAAMTAAINRYFEDKKIFDDAYKDDPAMKFAYSLDDYLNGARYNIEKH